MRQKRFRELLADIRRTWTSVDGLLVWFRSRRQDPIPDLRLCIGPVTNDGIVAEKGKLWHGDRIVYDGILNSDAFNEALERYSVCGAYFTCIRDKTAGKPVLCRGCYSGQPCIRTDCGMYSNRLEKRNREK